MSLMGPLGEDAASTLGLPAWSLDPGVFAPSGQADSTGATTRKPGFGV